MRDRLPLLARRHAQRQSSQRRSVPLERRRAFFIKCSITRARRNSHWRCQPRRMASLLVAGRVRYIKILASRIKPTYIHPHQRQAHRHLIRPTQSTLAHSLEHLVFGGGIQVIKTLMLNLRLMHVPVRHLRHRGVVRLSVQHRMTLLALLRHLRKVTLPGRRPRAGCRP